MADRFSEADRLHRYNPEQAGEELVSVFARAFLDDEDKAVLEQLEDGSIILSRSGNKLADAGGNLVDARFGATISPGGTVGDGLSDDTDAIQTALALAGYQGGGTVLLDATKRYAIRPGVIVVPTGVILTFGYERPATARAVVNFEAGYPLPSFGAGQPPMPPTTGGQFVMLAGSAQGWDGDRAPAYIEMGGPRSGLVGASFYDSLNPSTNQGAVPTPFAVRSRFYGTTLERIELINTYRGLDVRGGRTVVRDITGNPLALGIRVDESYDVTRLFEIHFVDSFVRGTALQNWFRANSQGFQFLDNDYVVASRIFAFSYRIGAEFAASPVSTRVGLANQGTYGILSDSGFDGCQLGVIDSATQIVGMNISGTSMSPVGYDAATARGYASTTNKTGMTRMLGCNFWGTALFAALIQGGNVEMRGCYFMPDYGLGTFIRVETGAFVSLTENIFKGHAATWDIDIQGGNGYATGNRVFQRNGDQAPCHLNNDSPGFAVTTETTDAAFRALTTQSPRYLWKATQNPVNYSAWESVLDPYGHLQINRLSQDESAKQRVFDLNPDGGLGLLMNTQDYDNVGGADSAVLVTNQSPVGQSVIAFLFPNAAGGSVLVKMRADYAGNLSFDLPSGGHLKVNGVNIA